MFCISLAVVENCTNAFRITLSLLIGDSMHRGYVWGKTPPAYGARRLPGGVLPRCVNWM